MLDRHYSRAPITEAVIDLRVEFDTPPTQSDFLQGAERLRGQFPVQAPIHFFEMNFGPGDDDLQPSFNSAQTEVGVRLTSAEHNRVLQVQRHGFTYSHMPPYSQWSSFSEEAKNLWNAFVASYRPATVVRVAVRYINRIVVPSSTAKFDEYFTLYPTAPPGVLDEVTGCFMQIASPQRDIAENAAAVINFALEPNTLPGNLSFLLDFDVYSTCRCDPTSPEIWELLGRLRARKNELFESSITDKSRGLFV
jgi:uncharacterized protein (TIGR04255 family)